METSIARIVVGACIYGIHIVWVAGKELIGENLSKGDMKMADVDRCVCCGEIVPEGRMVCPQCEIKLQSKPDTGDFAFGKKAIGKGLSKLMEMIGGTND